MEIDVCECYKMLVESEIRNSERYLEIWKLAKRTGDKELTEASEYYLIRSKEALRNLGAVYHAHFKDSDLVSLIEQHLEKLRDDLIYRGG